MAKKKQTDKSDNSIDIADFINYDDIRNSKSSKRKSSSGDKNYSYDYEDNYEDEYEEEYEEEPKPVKRATKKKSKKKRKSKLLKLLTLNMVVLTVFCCILFLTPAGKKAVINMAGNYIYSNLNYESSKSAIKDLDTGTINPEKRNNNKPQVSQKPIMNFLLIGIEEIKGDKNTDSMMIATLNTKTDSIKLTSLMRDLYVTIPGYKDGRLNSVYAKGGIDLMYETIKLNFDIDIDGYCMVNFEAFEQIVDIIGGIEITLTEKEAQYLRTTNYISKKENRKVVAGKQLMNGNQVLGYCRVRKVSTGTESSDFGRTQRQRIVLQQIYNKLKSKNVVSLVLIMNKILNQVEIKTDISNKTFNYCLEEAVNIKIHELETLRVPKNGSYKDATVTIGSKKAAVLIPKDWDATRKYIYDFISDTGTKEGDK